MEQPLSVMIKHFSFAKTSVIIYVTNWSEAEVDDLREHQRAASI